MNFPGFLIGVGILGAIVWLVINRKNITPLYHGVLWSMFLPTWVLIGLIYTLGPWHNLRIEAFRLIGYVLAGPFYILTYVFGGHTHFSVVFFITAFTGFCLGLGLGYLIQWWILKK